MSSRQYLWIIVSHTVAAGLGYAVWTAAAERGSEKPGHTEKSALATEGRAESFRRRDEAHARALREEQKARGDSLLAGICGRYMEEADLETGEDIYNELADHHSIADPAARVAELTATLATSTEGYPTELFAAYVHWMRKDPEAAMKHLNDYSQDDTLNTLKLGVGESAIRAMVARNGWESMVPYLATDGQMDAMVREAVTHAVAKQGDAGGLQKLKEMSGAAWDQLLSPLAQSWPLERADALFQLAVAEKYPDMLEQFVYKYQDKAAGWLLEKLDDPALPEEMRKELMEGGMADWLVERTVDGDLEKRISLLTSGEDHPPREVIEQHMITQDVTRALNQGRDWRYAFRNGEVTATEVLEGVRAALPQQDSRSHEGVTRQVFMELAEENGAEAVKLLDGMPPEKKQQMILAAADEMFNDVNPETLHQFLKLAPEPDAGESGNEAWEARLKVWAMRGLRNHERLGTAYVEWVESLPPGLDKEMASFQLISGGKELSDAQTSRLGASLTDSRWKKLSPEKISEVFPPEN